MNLQINNKGMTLIELLIGLAVLSVLVMLSVSGFSTLLASARMNSQVNILLHSFHTARQISRARGIDVAVCKSVDGRQCTTNGNWHDGWMVFANLDGDHPPRRDPDEALLEVHESVRQLDISANRHAFVLRPFGKRSTNGTLVYCDRRGSKSARSIIISYTGKPRSSNKSASGRALVCAVNS
jgi:type IV fimbrial biogenesis protein FimT